MASYVGKVTGTDGTTGPVGSTLYGTCSTAAATVAKEVTLANFDKLLTGVTIHVKFTNSNTASSPTLNVNGTGAKSIYRYGTTVPSTSASWSWYAGAVVSFTYDGSAWIMNDMIGNDNTYDRTYIQTRIYAGTKGVFPYSICALDNEQRMQAMTTTGGTATTKAFNSSEKFLYPPVVMYHSANSTIADGSVIANGTLYEQFPSVDLRYSSNITTSAGFTQYKPVYIECSFDTNGYWSPSGITQTFVAGKFYILLGCMYSTSIYQLALFAEHPVYYCETAGTIKKWELLGSKYKNGYWGITSPYGADTNWTRTTRSGLIPYAANNDSTDGNVSNLGTSTWSFVNGFINNVFYKDLKPITVVAGGTDNNGIDKMAGSYFFSGNNLIGGINDWIGLQAGNSGDKFQLIGRGGSASTVGHLLYRQNDSGGTNIDNWSSWVGLLTPDEVTADTGLTATVVNTTLGSGTAAEDIPTGVKISHTNSVTAVTTASLLKFKYDAQGHITGSSAATASDLPSHTHNYAGSSSAGGAATSANKLNTNAGSEVQPVYFSGGIPVVTHLPASGEYYGVPQIREGDGLMEVGKYIDFHSAVTSANDYDTRLQCDDTNVLTLISKGGTSTLKISGTLPRLRFSQTTSSATFNNDWCGITAHPGNASGVNLVMAGGGNTFVGGGESPHNLHARVITTDTNPYGTSSFIGNEKMFLTSDAEIYFVSGANGITDTNHTDWTHLKTALFDGDGYFRPSINDKGSIGSESYEWHSGYIHNIYGTFNHIKTNPTSGTIYGVSFHMGANTEEPKYLRTSDGIRCSLLEGTTSAKGYGALILGNNITSGTALNKYGLIRMYGSGSNYIQLSAGGDDDTLRFFCIDTGGANVTGANMSPSATGIYDLGTSSLRWRNVYARSLDGNLRSAFIYSNESNATSYPWHKFAEMTITAANSDSIITFLVSRTMSGGDKIGILTVRVRTGSTKIFSAGYIHFNYHDSDLNPDDFVGVYTNTANTSCKIELYCKIAERYGGIIATVLKEHNRVDTIDSWTLTKYSASANGVASVPAGTGHLTMLSGKQEVLYEATSFARASWNTVTFSKNVFGVYKLALLIIDQCEIETNSYENAATYILPLDYIKSLGVDPYPPYLTGTGWSTKNNTYTNIRGPEGDCWDVAVTYVSNTSLKFSKSGNTNMATNNANVKIIGIM